jgi:hypothetical protein
MQPVTLNLHKSASYAHKSYAPQPLRMAKCAGDRGRSQTPRSAAHAHNEIGVLLKDSRNNRDAKEYFSRSISASAIWYEEAQRNLSLGDERLRKPAGG